MRKLKDLNWFEQCIVKLEVAEEAIENMRKLKVFTFHDQVKVNIILNLLKAPMDYCMKETAKKYRNIRKRAYIPVRNEKENIEKFKQRVQNEFEVIDPSMVELFVSIQDFDGNAWYREFNKMNNDEKHSNIVYHLKTITENNGVLQYNDGLTEIDISNNITVYDEGSSVPTVEINGKIIPLNEGIGGSKEEDLRFEHNNEEVFDFLREVLINVNEFVLDTYKLLEDEEPGYPFQY